MIWFENVMKCYCGMLKFVFFGVDFEVQCGEFVFFVGVLGFGKFFCLWFILCEDVFMLGCIVVLGCDLCLFVNCKVFYFCCYIGLVFQDFWLLLLKIVYQNVVFMFQVMGFLCGFIQQVVFEVFVFVGFDGKQKCMLYEFFGGEQQCVVIVCVFVNCLQVLFVDELIGNFDFVMLVDIMQLFVCINVGGIMVLMVMYEVGFVDQMQCCVIEFCDGEMVCDEVYGGYGDIFNIFCFVLEEVCGVVVVVVFIVVQEVQCQIVDFFVV